VTCHIMEHMRLLLATFTFSIALSAADFAREVAPVLAKRCMACHGAAMQMNGFRLDDGEAARKGGYSGASIVPGQSSKSPLVARLTSAKEGFMMPPAGPRLTAAEVRAVAEWIDAGAVFPAGAKAKTAAPAKSSHWAFQPLAPVAASASVDKFILAKLAQEKVEPAPPADRATLLRRLSLDLRGLPPTLAEQKEFLSDTRPDAYERLVDRMLSSPHYGERWARPWLDLARYADSDGFEKDLARPWSWRYRHWLIEALNADMPFDRFTQLQIAGDLLPGATAAERVATGFHRMTLHNREAGVARAEDRFEQVVNRTNTVSTTWLGLTSGCAQCHDHKYDPISQREYYQLFSIFNNAGDEEIDAPLPGELGPWLQAKPAHEAKRQALFNEYNVPALQAEYETHMRAAITTPGNNVEWDFWVTSCTAMLDGCPRLILTPPGERLPRDAARLTDYFVANPGPEFPRNKALMEKLKELRGKLAEINKTLPRYSQAYVLTEQPVKTFIAVRGDYKRPGVEVQPGTLAVLPPFAPQNGEPARLAFAQWLVSAENPLTPRVMVNRAWQEFFGRGLVKTSEDFGAQGDRPTHPELLDYLAREFQRDWSMKRLHRLIVTSATYRQSSSFRPELKDRDPDNAWIARQQRLRLPAELIRDSALAVSGLLNPAVGGPSVKPPQPASVVELGYGKPSWNESTGGDRYRRGLYIHFQRTTPYPMLMTFDMPDSNVACSRRRNSNTPLQSLNLLNDPVFFETAQALALQLAGLGLEQGFAAAVGRAPTPKERDRLASLRNSPAISADARWLTIARVLLNLDEFMTRE
jgi:mono/diheme cytochrome c family protein